MARETRQQLKERINKLEDQVSSEQASKDDVEQNLNQKIKDLENKHKKEINEHKEKISNLEVQVEEKQKQLDKRELKKLAEEYGKQEVEYASDRNMWFWVVAGSFGVLIIAILLSAEFASDLIWYERIPYHLVNFVVITFLVFALKQFSFYKKLRVDYANRKTLAQSYHNIINTADDTGIKNKFIEKATDVLASGSEVSEETHTIPEKLIESLSEISKNLSKKV